MPQEFIRKSLELTAQQWHGLERLADLVGALAPTGPSSGEPSWRTLIKMLADGQFVITRIGDHDVPSVPV